MQLRIQSSYQGSSFEITETGMEALGPDAPKAPENNDEAQNMLKETLSVGKSKKMFDILTDGAAYTRAEIAEKVGMDPSKKTFQTYISYLSKIVEKVDRGKIRLIETAFPCGRPCDKAD